MEFKNEAQEHCIVCCEASYHRYLVSAGFDDYKDCINEPCEECIWTICPKCHNTIKGCQ